jgi:NAD(P)-dependent dehydrogenase (short-subunit alcohol dehydrogenase family)
MKDFAGKTAVITGAASGIGQAIAERCAQEGMKVVLADIEEGALQQTARELKEKGTSLLAIRTDVSKMGDVETLAKRTVEEFGAVHLLFNNAGVQVGAAGSKAIWEDTIADWEWVLGVNLWGVIYGIRSFVPLMIQQGTECHITNTASVGGVTSGSELGIYRITKSGIIMLSETLYHQFKFRDIPIGVSVLFPGFVRSRLNDAERNRPPALQNLQNRDPLTSQESAVDEVLRTLAEKAMAPEHFADLVFKAIQENKLYVLTHPEFMGPIAQRTEDILHGVNPAPSRHGFPIEDLGG